MKRILPLLWAFCFLCIFCESAPSEDIEDLDGVSTETLEVPPAAQDETEEAPGPESAGAKDGDSVTTDFLKEDETPEFTLIVPFPPDLSADLPAEFTALPDPLLPDTEIASETVITVFPEPAPILQEAAILYEPPALEMILEPESSLVQFGPAAAPVSEAAPPPSPPSPPPAQSSPPVSVPAQAPSAPPRLAEAFSPPEREALTMPTSAVPSLPFKKPPVLPVIPPSEEEIEYSRIIRAGVGQTIEIPFRGTGWVYLGEIFSLPGVTYNSKRSDAEGQTFIFKAEKAGTFGLKFYRQDFIRDYILNDYVQVIAGEAPTLELPAPSGGRGAVITAPRWPDPSGGKFFEDTSEAPASDRASPALTVPSPSQSSGSQLLVEAPVEIPAEVQDGGMATSAFTGSAGAAAGLDDISGDFIPPLPKDVQPEEYFRKAREAFESETIAQALAILDRFRENYPLGSDEAWWLYGQFLEASGPSRDIRRALDYYRRLVRDYPQSPRCENARRRIAYLERFYFNIR
jgi:hypothetical protein